jgi:arginyl-tRNA--protein-N-Asp/Glu arginylyltransferase
VTVSQKIPDLYLSMPHECGYLEDRIATTLFVDPHVPLTRGQYTALVQKGFRRSGALVYRPHCQGCNACVPVRIPVNRFAPSRAQRRNAKRNSDLVVQAVESGYRESHFDLYCRYQSARHRGGSMDVGDPVQYREFLFSSDFETRAYEFRPHDDPSRLVAVAVADRLDDGLSAVYTFFDPAEQRRAPGVFGILWEIDEARRLDLPYLYLGYWIGQSPKMRYKTAYRPLQAFLHGEWQDFSLDANP